MSRCSKNVVNAPLFDHLVGEDVELRRNGQAELVGSRAVGAARWHCVRYVMAITKKRFSFPNCAKRTGSFLTAPALAGISSDLMQSQEA
ncbi:MAG TPA: hypothetical protein VKP67_25595, partial [Xanthobacteraceae bacterium]|nr:hypothetical protein [Xanthobacteraceae bacterium]